ncbi:hypothetical protein [Klebsiella pneumoniae]|uniref:hypothetical protein n=1 Tax=Klebsiella pneumoniae TaxID=573 RepID=UPI00388CF7DE
MKPQEARGDQAWTPKNRQRQVSFALRAYASLATSAPTKAQYAINQAGWLIMADYNPCPALWAPVPASGTARAGL